MSFILKEIIKNKLRQLTVEELLSYAHQYNFSITAGEAKTILTYLQNQQLDVFSKHDIAILKNKLAEVTNEDTANKAMQLFNQIVSSYGLESLFD
ncbi:DUF2624 family protein [Oceanobacillus sp. CAU 1775]